MIEIMDCADLAIVVGTEDLTVSFSKYFINLTLLPNVERSLKLEIVRSNIFPNK